MNRLLILVVLLAGVCHGQVFEIRAGASSIFQADGSQAIFYTQDTTSEFDLGFVQGRIQIGGGFNLERGNCSLFLGDRQLGFYTAAAGISVSLAGVDLTCKSDRQTFSLFTGGVGTSNFSPYFQAVQPHQFGTGFMYNAAITKDLNFTGIAALSGRNRTLLESLKYSGHRFHFEETAGSNGSRYYEMQASYQGSHFGANLSRFTASGVTANSEGVAAGKDRFAVFGSAFQSTGQRGEAVGGSFTVGPLTVQPSLLVSTRKQWDSLFTERLSRHFTVNQFVASGTVNVGGSYTSNMFTVSTAWNEVWNQQTGFAKVLTASIAIQLPRLTTHAAADVLPNNRILGTVYGDSYLQTATFASGSGGHEAD